MKDSFGLTLRSFANSIDILREDEFQRVLSSTRKYLANNFNINKVERLSEIVKSGVPHLAPTLSEDDQYDLYPVRDEEGRPNGLNAAAFTRRCNFWVTPCKEESDKTLDTAETYDELWNADDAYDLPRFVRLPGPDGEPRPPRSTRTLISVPISRRQAITALMYYESPDLLKPTDRAKEELSGIAQSLARLYDLQLQNKETHSATARELDEMEEICRVQGDWGAVPSLFWAYPEDGNGDVLALLERVLRAGAAAERFQLEDWRQNRSGGRVPVEIERKIRSATYFVAYLSEPSGSADSDGPTYTDNRNVLYEAGVFQGIALDPTSRGQNWMLIREKASPEAPFDITTVNTMIVGRDEAGGLLEREFELEVEARLKAFIGG